MLSFLTWKIGTYVASAALIGAGIYVAVLKIDNNRLSDRVMELTTRLETAERNTITLNDALDRQSGAIYETQRQAQQRITALQVKLKDAEKGRIAAERRAARLAAEPIKGNTLEERIADVDARVLGNLNDM